MAIGTIATKQPGGMMDILAQRGAYNPLDARYPYRLRENWRFWHRLAYAAAGTVAKIQFFNANPTAFVTNVFNANALPQNYWFETRSIGIRCEASQGLDGTGGATGNEVSNPAAVAAIAADDALTTGLQLMRIIRNGVVKFTVADIDYFERYGLDSLPYGGGPSVQGAISTDNSTTAAVTSNYSRAIMAVHNGDPNIQNRLRYAQGLVIPPLVNWGMSVQYQSLLPLTNGGVIEAYIEGNLFTPRAQ